ncbi:MAG: hypothetical protein JWO19_1530 [Bryobacterales bacterium]|nr:hypothetical protein [Bryobacterales bacterium]
MMPMRAKLGTASDFERRMPAWLSPILGTVFAAFLLHAQTPVAPTTETVGIPRGDNVSGYNIRQSFELGYRWHTVGGDEGMYRSTVNYGNGPRLLSSSLSVNSVEGHGGLFDLIQLNTLGLGNDPYESATLRVEKNRLYRYDLSWRSNAYFNPGLTIANGEHFIDTVRHVQDHDLTLFPQSSFKLFLGYSSNTQTGPALTTIQLFDVRGDEYPLFANIRRSQHEYRVGGEARFLGFRLNVLHAWVDFKDDTPVSLTSPEVGNNPSDLNSLTSFSRSEPYHGTSPYWRVALFRENKLWAANGRFSYVAGRRAFVDDETAVGFNRLGTPTSQQVITLGNAERPALAGNLTFSLFPSSKLTLTNQTSIYNIRMVGNAFYTQVTNGIPITPFFPFTFLGIRTIANSTDADLRLTKWFGVRAGYEYSTRRIRSIETTSIPSGLIEQENRLHTGLLGLRIHPVKVLTILLDTEIGRADRPIYPISQRNYEVYRGRIEYKLKSFRVAGFTRTDYNTNSASLANYASHSRQYGIDTTWALKSWFSIDASYAKLHLDTLGAINYFAQFTPSGPLQQVTNNLSFYVSNIHTGNLAARFSIGQRVDLSVGYSHVQDVGDGRPAIVITPRFNPIVAFDSAQTFPLRYLSPQGRISLRINEKLRWNAGYQNYGYHEDFSGLQNYRAHTGYTSVLWSF